MADPVATYGAKILAKGYKISGDMRSGIKATVPYLLPWGNVSGFVNALVTPITQVRVGLITFSLPYQLPTTAVATPIYAHSFDIQPVGLDDGLNVTTVLPNGGIGFNEKFFKYGLVTVGFEQLTWSFDGTQDPNGLNQLDPANPITYCEQSVKIGGKMVTRKGLNFIYTDDSKPVVGDVGVLTPEAKLVLKFPRVPYLPWQLLVPYVGTVNSSAVLGCAAETLLLEAPDTQVKQAINSPVPMEQAVTLEFAYDPNGWNKLPKPDGTLMSVTLKGDTSRGVYTKSDFRQIFNSLSYSSG